MKLLEGQKNYCLVWWGQVQGFYSVTKAIIETVFVCMFIHTAILKGFLINSFKHYESKQFVH